MVNKKYLILFIMLICLALPVMANGNASCYSVADNLISNCGFETGNFDDWSLRGEGYEFVIAPANYTGSYGADLHPAALSGSGYQMYVAAFISSSFNGNDISGIRFHYKVNQCGGTSGSQKLEIGIPIIYGGDTMSFYLVDETMPDEEGWIDYYISKADLDNEISLIGDGSATLTTGSLSFLAYTYRVNGAYTGYIEVYIDDVVITLGSITTCTNATAITSNSATLCAVGGENPKWFKYGQLSGHLSWQTPNFTGSTYNVHGSPLLGNTVFYYSACDESGCGSEQVFKTLSLTPQVQTTFSQSLNNITSDPSNIAGIASESVSGYFWLLNPAIPTSYSIVWGLVFLAIFLGLWIRERDLTVPVILGLITGTFIMYSNAGLNLGIPVYFQSMAQGIAYASLAGVILAFVKRS